MPKPNKRVPTLPKEDLMVMTIGEIIAQLIKAVEEKRDVNLNKLKAEVASKYGLSSQPRLVDLIAAVPLEHKHALLPRLKAKPVRSASGIVVIAVMCKPHRCPHIAMTGNVCVYCPGGPDSDFEYSTQSYTGYEIELIRRDYVANGGWETFLAYEDPYQDILIGLLRLRQCSPQTFRSELRYSQTVDGQGETDPRCSIVRELHVYGSAVPIAAKDPTKFQHQVSSYGSVLRSSRCKLPVELY
ncbi:hypothetical protein CRM22_008903 [Opisthorchis felineus]|uniref:ELP3-like N-terminal domain-containing protein n=1 Tax=Opisthorchis felineus TaxID=147828 RepID=A0A4S2LH82_OPIFE|nr:hypothetical protein CRM22_008903 [Opisthorchis felineus]